MQETAFAKINLALHVRAREADGYHRIETIFAFCEDGDVLTAEPGHGLSLEVRGPFAAALADESDNLVLRAARALHPEGEGRLLLDKRLPVASGIGGGSADAAAALRLLNRFWDLNLGEDRLLEIAAQLGADVPACLLSRTARGEGRGDRLVPLEIEGLAGMPLLLVNPGVGLSTAAVFNAWDGMDCGPLDDWRNGRNDLEAPARALVPDVGDVLRTLSGALFCRMSGSGATCFGIFHEEGTRDATASEIAAAHPDWWIFPTQFH